MLSSLSPGGQCRSPQSLGQAQSAQIRLRGRTRAVSSDERPDRMSRADMSSGTSPARGPARPLTRGPPIHDESSPILSDVASSTSPMPPSPPPISPTASSSPSIPLNSAFAAASPHPAASHPTCNSVAATLAYRFPGAAARQHSYSHMHPQPLEHGRDQSNHQPYPLPLAHSHTHTHTHTHDLSQQSTSQPLSLSQHQQQQQQQPSQQLQEKAYMSLFSKGQQSNVSNVCLPPHLQSQYNAHLPPPTQPQCAPTKATLSPTSLPPASTSLPQQSIQSQLPQQHPQHGSSRVQQHQRQHQQPQHQQQPFAISQKNNLQGFAQPTVNSGTTRENPAIRKWMTPAVIKAGYSVQAVVSEGSFGTVLRACRDLDGEVIALKAVAKARLSEKECATVRKQAFALRALRHRYIVQFCDDFEDADYFYHIFEYLHGGDLYDRLECRGKPFSEAQVLFLARQIFYAVSYLHSKRAAHRDIKLENFVFETSPTDERQVMKLIDFDLLVVRSRQTPRTETCADMCGTILYVSPEIASGREHVPEESDMWACGVMLFVLLSYQMPFQGATGRQILRAVRTTEPHFAPAVWSNVSAATKALVKDLLNKNAADRPTAEQALERVKHIQSQARQSGSSSRLRALTRGLRSVSLNLWDPSGNLVRRGSRHTTHSETRSAGGSGRILGKADSGSLQYTDGAEWGGGSQLSPVSGPPALSRQAELRGSGRMADSHNLARRRKAERNSYAYTNGGGGGGRRMRGSLSVDEDEPSSMSGLGSTSMSFSAASSVRSSTLVQSDRNSETEAASTASLLHCVEPGAFARNSAMECGTVGNIPTSTASAGGSVLCDKSIDGAFDSVQCLTSPALGGMMSSRSASVAPRAGSYALTRGITDKNTSIYNRFGVIASPVDGSTATAGGGGGSALADDSGDVRSHVTSVNGGTDLSARRKGTGGSHGDSAVLRASRRLKKSGHGIGARLRQWMYKGAAEQQTR